MKKIFSSLAVILIGGAAAMLTQSFKSTNSAIVDGHAIDLSDPQNPVCVNMFVDCSTVATPFKCEDANGTKLWELVGTSCPNELYRP